MDGPELAGVFREVPGGLAISVKAAPRSSRPGVDCIRDGALTVRLKSAPVDGKANAELAETLSRAFGIPKRSVEIKTGASGKRKTVLLKGVSGADFAILLESLAK